MRNASDVPASDRRAALVLLACISTLVGCNSPTASAPPSTEISPSSPIGDTDTGDTAATDTDTDTDTDVPVEICDNQIDDEADGYVDCLDADCATESYCLVQCEIDDAFEPNNNLLAARLASGPVPELLHATLPLNDIDWFALGSVQPGEEIEVLVLQDPDISEVLLTPNPTIFDGGGRPLAPTRYANRGSAPMDLFARLDDLEDGIACSTYQLQTILTPLAFETCNNLTDDDGDGDIDCEDDDCTEFCDACLPDSLEPNGIGPGGVGYVDPATGGDLTVHHLDDDAYTFQVLPQHHAVARVTYDADVDISAVFRKPGSRYAWTSSGTNGDRQYGVFNDTDAPIQVDLTIRINSSDVCGDYSLDLVMAPGPPSNEDCTDGVDNDLDAAIDCRDYDCIAAGACTSTCPVEDAFEPSDGLQTTAGLPVEDATTFAGNEDWYRIESAPGEVVTAHFEGAPSAELLDGRGAFIQRLISGQTVHWYNAWDDSAFVRVSTTPFAVCQTYDVDGTSGIPDAEDCSTSVDDDLDGFAGCDDLDCVDSALCPTDLCGRTDAAGDNHTRYQPAQLGTWTDLFVHAQEPDWFTFTVQPGELVEVRGTYDTAHIQSVDARLDFGGFDLLDGRRFGNQTSEPREHVLQIVPSDSNGVTCAPYAIEAIHSTLVDEECFNQLDDDGDGAVDCEDADCSAGPFAALCGCASEDALGVIDSSLTAVPFTEGFGRRAYRRRSDWYTVVIPPASQRTFVMQTDFSPTSSQSGGSAIHSIGGALLSYDEDLGRTGASAHKYTIQDLRLENRTSTPMTQYLVAGSIQLPCVGYDLVERGSGPLPPLEVCDDGVDDDGDGHIDCRDPDCSSAVSCGCPPPDPFEPNDNERTAPEGPLGPTDLSADQSWTNGGTLLLPTPDFFRYTVPGGGTLIADTSHLPTSDPFRLDLTDGLRTRNLNTRTAVRQDGEELRWVNESGSAQDVLLRVAMDQTTIDLCLAYTLDVSIE